ncbi:phage BR0599 family protein [Novosphingobium sp. YJ-S2-02]|uniref:Phage BR0599 family protein n=1 Tax=Novosphingobium aureum TaxID=2792964 RepID=A0A931ML97_9SPHN|nr:phage BR0599 family protein [Novosphingobium aureum]MBH0113259.1 phage BR0599 family protein [Novosphingobium aureum]
MSFDEAEISRNRGMPVELYLFQYGPDAAHHYAYTSAEEEVEFDNIVYVPTPMQRDGTKSSGTLDKSSESVRTGALSEAAELFRIYPPSQEVALIIRQGHLNDPDEEFPVTWAGRVLSCKWEDSQVELTCESIATSMKRTGLRRHWQYGCPHALYRGNAEGGCHADKVRATVTGTVTAVSGNTLSLAEGWNGAFPKEKFRAGTLEWTNAQGVSEARTILRLDTAADTFTLSGLARDIAVDGEVSVVLGCNHQMDDCADLHLVINDFGGDPWIPRKNPFVGTNNYY